MRGRSLSPTLPDRTEWSTLIKKTVLTCMMFEILNGRKIGIEGSYPRVYNFFENGHKKEGHIVD